MHDHCLHKLKCEPAPLLGRASYWSSQLIISLIRYFFVMYPIQVYNCLPNNNYKNKIFYKLLRYLQYIYIYLYTIYCASVGGDTWLSRTCTCA